MADVKTKRLRVAGSFGGSGSGDSSSLPIPASAEVGQYIRVAAVDENGVVTSTEAVDAPTLPDAEEVAF